MFTTLRITRRPSAVSRLAVSRSHADADRRMRNGVALSGVIAGNTAICTVGHTGNDLHYRGYDIVELAERGSYEEIAHLLIHGALPTQQELDAYRARLAGCRR